MGLVTNAEFDAAWNNTDNARIMGSVVKKFAHQLSDVELEGVKYRSLWKTLQKHDPPPNSKQKFTSSLYNYTRWECLKTLKSEDGQKELSCGLMDDLVSNSGTAPVDPLIFKDCISQLPQRDREFIQHRFYDNMTYREIGEVMEISAERARKCVQKAVDKFKVVFCEGDI